MLLNEFLKEHKKVEQLQATVAHQQEDFQRIVDGSRSRLTRLLQVCKKLVYTSK